MRDGGWSAPVGYDAPRVARAVREILVAIGEDPDRHGLRATPERVARSLAELTAGLRQRPEAAHGRITGLSRLARLVEVYARRPQLQ